MELKIKILEIFPNIKNIKLKPSDIISLSFEAENVVVKIDNIEKSIINKDNILLLLKEFSPKQKISFNLLRNDKNILGKGKFFPLPGIKWHKIYELINRTEGNAIYNSKTLSRKNLNINNNSSDISSNSSIKVKLDIQMNILKTPISKKSKGRIKFSPKKSYNINGNKNKSNLNGTSNIDDKYNNSLMSSNMSSNFNKFKSYRKISSYAATPGLKSPRYYSIFNREKINSIISKDNSSGDNSLKEYNLPILDNENRKKKKDSSKRTPSGKKILFDSHRYKAKYGFNKNQEFKKAKSTDKSMDNYISSDKKTRMSKEIEEEILDNNFKNIIKYDENLRAKEITDFNLDNNNSINNQENDINNNNDNNNNTKKSFTQNKGVTFNINNNLETNNSNINTNTSISKIKNNENSNNNANSSEPINNNIKINANSNIVNSNNDNKINDKNINNKITSEYNNSNNELSNVNAKDDFNKIIQNSVVSSVLSSNRIFNSGCDIDLSVDDLSGSFSAGYDNISKILPIDEFRKITYDIETENISKYENIKKDFILFYNKEYINSINEEMLILELQLMIDKILEMQNVYKRQTIIIQKNFELYKKKIVFYQKRNLLMNKKKNKLEYEKLKNTYNEELNDLYYNNKKTNFYNNKNIFKTNELSLWNNLTLYINEKNSKKENEIKNIKKKFNDIFILICNKNLNNLNALSKKFVLEFSEKQKEKKEMNKNNSFNSNKKKNDNINLKYKKLNHKNNSQKDVKFNIKNNNIISLNKSNKILKVNDTFFKKKNKKDIFQIKGIATEESININNTNINNDERIKKVKFKSNELEGISNRNHLHKNGFNTAKYLKKKSSNKKGK